MRDDEREIEAYQAELLRLNDEMKRHRATLNRTLFDMQKIEERREDIFAGMARHVTAIKGALSQTFERVEDKQREGNINAMALRLQMDDMAAELVQEKSMNTLLQQELGTVGYPVVGCELSEGAPYDIEGVWVVNVVHGGAASQAGIRSGDVISEVGGVPTPTREAFRRAVNGGTESFPQGRPGHQLAFRVHREAEGGEHLEMLVMVTLGWSWRRPEGKRTITVSRATAEERAKAAKHVDTTCSPQTPNTPLTPRRAPRTPPSSVKSPSLMRAGGVTSPRTRFSNTTDPTQSPTRQSRFL